MQALLRNFAARFEVLSPGVLFHLLMTKAKAYFQFGSSGWVEQLGSVFKMHRSFSIYC